MAEYIRKVSLSKWKIEDELTIESLEYIKYPSLALTNELKLDKDSLSLWRIDSKDQVEDIILALALNMDNIQKIDIILLNESELEEEGFKFNNEKGQTILENINSMHRNIEQLKTVEDTCKLAKKIYLAKENSNYQSFTKKQVEKIVTNAVEKKVFDLDKLKPNIKKDIVRIIEKKKA